MAAALLGAAAACKPATQDLGDPSITLSSSEMTFSKAAGSNTVSLTATRAWKVEDLADWLVVEPQKGEASLSAQSVTVSVLENTGKDRSCTVTFTIGLDKTYLTVSQEGPGGSALVPEGDGTQANPYSASQAHAVAAALESGATTSGKVYVRGIVHKLASGHEAAVTGYGNALFYISDDGEASDEDFYCFQVYYLGGKKFTSADQVKVGDDVVVYGQLTNYSGTCETVGKGQAYVYSLNGETAGGGSEQEQDYTKAEARTVAEFLAAADESTYYKLTGTVSSFNSTYCSFDLTDATGTIYVYSVDNKADWSDKMGNGGTVTLAGKYSYYAAKQQHEVVNAYILSFDGSGIQEDPTEGEEITGDNLLADCNPGFETWNGDNLDANWQFASGNATVTKSTDAHSGSFSAEVAGNSSSNKRLMSKSFTLKAGTYQLKAWVKGAGYVRLGYAKLTGGVVADTSNDYIYLDDAVAAGSDWNKIRGEFTLSSDTEVSLIVMNNKKGGGESFLVDDVELVTKDGGITAGGDDPGTTVTVPFEQMNAASVKEGKYVVSYLNGTATWVMKAEVKSSYYVTATEFDLTKGEKPTEEHIFTIAKSGDGYTIKTYDGKYMGITVSGTHYNLVPNLTEPYVWTFTAAEGGIIAKGANSGDYFLSYNTGYKEFTTSTNTSYAPQYYYIGE